MSHQPKHSSSKETAPSVPRRKWLLPAALLIAAVIVVGGVVAIVAANQQPPYKAEVTGRPSVQVSQDQFDYGTHHYGETVNASFQVKNVGDQTLFVLGAPQIEVVTGCCPPQTQITSKTLHPGEEATVSYSFMMHQGMDGPHDYRVHVRTSDPDVPDKTVEVLSNWVP